MIKMVTDFCRGTPEAQKERQEANEGCLVCPVCGEKKSAMYYIEKEDRVMGVQKCGAEELVEGRRAIRWDNYRCLTCGARWKSLPYKWERAEI